MQMDEEIKLISSQRIMEQDFLSREMDKYDDLAVRNQETAASEPGVSYRMNSTNQQKRIRNLDSEYEVSNRRPKPISKQFSTEYLDKFGSYSPRNGRPDSSTLKNAGHNLIFDKHNEAEEVYTNPLFGFSEGTIQK